MRSHKRRQSNISIHALLAESDFSAGRESDRAEKFLSTLSLRRATIFALWMALNRPLFLSTLSLRRATERPLESRSNILNFYPRSPCGERPSGYPRPCGRPTISIHALLAESDPLLAYCQEHIKNFYPRSPCGERRFSLPNLSNMEVIFLSTLSLRRATFPIVPAELITLVFLSTLSLRRATRACAIACMVFNDFYPRSPCGERPRRSPLPSCAEYFYPRSPCGERRLVGMGRMNNHIISIHALLAESDLGNVVVGSRMSRFLSTLSLRRATPIDVPQYQILEDFYPRSPCGERLIYCHLLCTSYSISIHALLAESDF